MSYGNQTLSYSGLSKFQQCPRRFKRHYIDGERGKATNAMLFGSAIHDALEHLVKGGEVNAVNARAAWAEAWGNSELTRLKDHDLGLDIMLRWVEDWHNPEVLEVELHWRIDIYGKPYQGYIDRIDRVDSETVEIVDYKSGHVIESAEEIASDEQLALYDIAVRANYPWVRRVIVTKDFVRHGIRVSAERSYDDYVNAIAYFATEGDKARCGPYPARINRYCGSCPSRHTCTVYQDALETEPVIEVTPSAREQAAALEKIAKARKTEIDDEIKARLAEAGEVELDGVRYELRETTRRFYPAADVIDVLESYGVPLKEALSVCSVTKKRLDGILEGLPPAARESVERVARKRYSQRMMEVKG